MIETTLRKINGRNKSNKEVQLDDLDVNIFNKFESVVELLEKLQGLGIITVTNSIYDQITELFKMDRIIDTIKGMDYMLRRLDAFFRKDISFYYVLTSLSTVLGINASFTEAFIESKDFDNIFYPDRFRAIVIEEDIVKVHTLPSINFEHNNKYEVYFIYDFEGELAYIGKSTNCN